MAKLIRGANRQSEFGTIDQIDSALQALIPRDAKNTMTICKNQAIPPGWVIVAETSKSGCPIVPGTAWNAWIIRKVS